MGKIGLIIKREYTTRVRKRSFIIMTFLGPILMAAIGIVPVWLASVNESIRIIQVIDESGTVEYKLKSSNNIKFVYSQQPYREAKKQLEKSDFYAMVHIPSFKEGDLVHLQRNIKIYAFSQVSLNVKVYIENQIEKQLEREMLKAENVDQAIVERTESTINVQIPIIELADKKNKDTSADVEVSTALGAFSGILIYVFIFLFGAQVMRGVIEEKTNRIVEVIVSSVKPFQLMMGKIIGIAFVGLTQFLLWILLTAVIYTAFLGSVKEKFSAENVEMIMKKSPDGTSVDDIDKIMSTQKAIERVNQINWGLMIPCFIFYFIGGYLLYGALFAAIGGAVDSESDTQQFMLPITIPLIFSFVMAQTVLNDPTGTMAKWLSIIPFTSPIIMMVRLPFKVPVEELIASMVCLVLGFIFTTWIAAKIYRTGILMYGKRITWKDLGKWLRY
jgi:ABC-2 type transport system permease protein